MTNLFVQVEIHQQSQLPFVLYCKPNSDRIVGLFQQNDHLYFIESFEETGFVFAPFDGNTMSYIPHEYSDIIVEKVSYSDFYFDKIAAFSTDDEAKNAFVDLVQKGVNVIKMNQFQKVVLSRKEKVALYDFDLETTFKKLVHSYPTAFNYCFFHPKIGLWIGATPEQFLKINDKNIQTVALAGTQKAAFIGNVIWGKKEIEEQQLVTDFIVSSLNKKVDVIVVSKPYTITAGSLCHIKTDISAILKSNTHLKDIITSLHPTSAVCGLPKEEAKTFILTNEQYDREYYSGFLGELNIDVASTNTAQSDLFVNLRCMKIVDDFAEVFVGCGVTKDSIPEAEYQETVNKSLTMKKCIQ